MLHEKRKELGELKERQELLVDTFNLKLKELSNSALVIRGLIEKAQKGADHSLTEILTKWQQQNDQTLMRYPKDQRVDFEAIEATEARKAIEAQKRIQQIHARGNIRL